MEQPVYKALKEMMNNSLSSLEQLLESDVMTYFGPIVDGNENEILDIVEDLAKDEQKKIN